MSLDRRRGLSDATAFWKIICSAEQPRTFGIDSRSWPCCRPSNRISPGGRPLEPDGDAAERRLSGPDSPARPSTSPSATDRLTSISACTTRRFARPKRPAAADGVALGDVRAVRAAAWHGHCAAPNRASAIAGSGWKQRSVRPSAAWHSAGTASHSAVDALHRGAKRQPGAVSGRLHRAGNLGKTLRSPDFVRGTEASSPAV